MSVLTLISLKAWVYKDPSLMGLTFKMFYGFKVLINQSTCFYSLTVKIKDKYRLITIYHNSPTNKNNGSHLKTKNNPQSKITILPLLTQTPKYPSSTEF